MSVLLTLVCRYYRANSVRYPTQVCEGVCTLNHYCAITRVDYREFRQCLETAASALASNTRPIFVSNHLNRLFLLTLTLIQLCLHQRSHLASSLATALYLYTAWVAQVKTLLRNCSHFGFLLLLNLHKLVKLPVVSMTHIDELIVKAVAYLKT